jgi:PAS domain S-box-containing protein
VTESTGDLDDLLALALRDPERLARVTSSGALDAVGDPDWHGVARLARAVTGAAVAMVTVITDSHLVVCAADVDPGVEIGIEVGSSPPVEQVPCRWVVHDRAPVVIADLATDDRCRADTLPPATGLASYCGVPLTTADGYVLGTVCVLDTHPREWSTTQTEALLDLARLLTHRLALTEERRRADDLLRLHADVVGGSLSGLVVIDDRGVVLECNPAITTMLGWTPADLVGRRVADTLVPPAARGAHEEGLDRVRGGGADVVVGHPVELVALSKDGDEVPVELHVTRIRSSAGVRYSGSLRDLRDVEHVRAGLDSVLGSATVAVLEVDPAGTIRRAEGEGLLGGTTVVGRGLDDVLGPRVGERLLTAVPDGPTRLDLDALGRSWRASAIPLRPARGVTAGWVVSLIDITDVREAQAELARASRTDQLTGLLNRLGLEREVASLVAADPLLPLQVTTLRLHGLGETNESFGHEVGDELLRVSAARLRTLLPGGHALLARVDAGQFSLVGRVGRTVSAGWVGAAAALLARPVRVRAVTVAPQVSVGTATCDPAEVAGAAAGSDEPGGGPTAGAAVVTELLRRAEVAVHAARRAGTVVRAYDRGDDVAARRLVLASNLREALATPPDGRNPLDLGGRLGLAYQPVVHLPGGQTASVEALLRWHDDTLGALSPVEVVDVAESSGLAVPLGEHVLARALHDAASWWGSRGEVPVMVNLSALQVCDESLVGGVASLLARNGLPGRALVLEVTETAVLQDADLAAAVLGRLRELGVHVYLDDFGTGWSTLERLGHLPLDGIKLDRSFAARIDRPAGRAAVHSAVALARSLQVPLVVEGVETTEQEEQVVAAGADRAQGYLYSRPVDLATLRDGLTAQARTA